MEYAILKQFDKVSDYVAQVSSLADQNKGSFGFLSSTAYEQMASKGQLWIVTDENKELKGYLMFGGKMPALKVFQAYICESVRGMGVGKLLIDELKRYARENYYHSIVARVASDLPANAFWEAVGFSIYRQVKGGETTKRIINIRGYTLADNDLFGHLIKESTGVQPIGPILERPIYALDLNLLFDISKGRPGYEKAIKIIQVGFQGEFSLCITPEFKKELQRQSASFADDPVMRLAEAIPELKAEGDISATAESLRTIVFPARASVRKSAQNDDSDLMHLAYCIAAGIDGFVTRERALLRACSEIKDKHKVAIISPDELILEDSDSPGTYAPLNSDFTLIASSVSAEIRNFLNEFLAPSVITNMLANATPIKDATIVNEARLDGHLFGVHFFQKPTKTTNIALAALYIDENSPKSIAAIDHFLETTLRYKSGFSYRLDLYIGKGQDITEETLRKKGFFKLDDHFVKIIANLFLDEKNWPRFAKDVKSFCALSIAEKLPPRRELQNTGICFTDANKTIQVFSLFDFETIVGPRFIVYSDRECTLVPIQENYANGLMGNVKNQLSLLSSHDKTLLLEKAYFRSPSKASYFKKGGIVAFYVSGNKSIQELIGFARITYSDVIDIEEAAIKFGRQGVLSRDQLNNIADYTGKIHVFTFDNFLEFDKRVSFSRAKEIGLIGNANLVSPEKINSGKLKLLIGEAFND